MAEQIKVLFFAALREQLGASSQNLDIALPTQVAAIRAALSALGDNWAENLSDPKRAIASVNQDYASDDHPVNIGDEVAFFPPVTGG